MRAIVTVLGKDRVGIMSLVCALLAQHNVNILDISQTILQGDFTMVMLVDAGACDIPFAELAALLEGRVRHAAWTFAPSGRIFSTPCTGSEEARRVGA